MVVKRQGNLPLLGNQKIMDTIIMEKLNEIGIHGVKTAIEMHKFRNRTFNLEDSYGFGIYYNGALKQEPFTFSSSSTKSVKFEGKEYRGQEEVMKYLQGYKPDNMGWSLVVVAAMPYASFVEDYWNLDVLQTSFMEAKQMADVEMKNIPFYTTK